MQERNSDPFSDVCRMLHHSNKLQKNAGSRNSLNFQKYAREYQLLIPSEPNKYFILTFKIKTF